MTAALAEHAALGRLQPHEHEERVSVALVARTRGDLAPLLADLPDLPADLEALREQSRRRRRAAAVAVLAPWALVCTGLWVLWLVLGADSSVWPIWPTFGWGIPSVLTALGILRGGSSDDLAAEPEGARALTS